MKIWIARDESGRLELFHEKPTYNYIKAICDYAWQHGDYIGGLDKTLFPEVTFDNSPQEVELKLVEKYGTISN